MHNCLNLVGKKLNYNKLDYFFEFDLSRILVFQINNDDKFRGFNNLMKLVMLKYEDFNNWKF